MENEFEDFVRKNRKDFDRLTPDPAILQKIKEQVKRPEKKKVIFLSSRNFQWLAAASVLLVVGLVILLKQSTVAKPVIADRTNEFTSRKNEVLYALNNTGSASQRLAGALAACELDKTDKSLIDMLVKVMNTDQNSNVRLASLDALSKFYREKYVQEQTLASLEIQDDPIVKTALIEFLTRMNETSITGELLKIVSDQEASKEIKDQAYTSLFKFNRL